MNRYGKKPNPAPAKPQGATFVPQPHPAAAPSHRMPAAGGGPLWTFAAVDTWFFRESRPMDSVGGAELKSVFPPPARTVMGAVRSAIGNAQGVHWQNYPKGPGHQALFDLIGDGSNLGRLSFKGPYLLRETPTLERLYPVPLLLLRSGAAFTRLAPSAQATHCDLGKVQLPTKQDQQLTGASPLEDAWLTRAGLQAVLQGQVPQAGQVLEAKDLFHTEDRLGIGRNNATRTTGDGLLYQTRHLRPQQKLCVGMVVQGLQDRDAVPAAGTVRLGGEGRMAHWSRSAAPADLTVPAGASTRLLLVLLTPARFTHGWLPDGLQAQTLPDGQTVWEGTLHGVRLRLLCAVLGKPVREGGWDLIGVQPRAMQSLVPAGSCYFCEVLTEGAAAREAAARLQGQQIGQDSALGRGEIAVGIWQ